MEQNKFSADRCGGKSHVESISHVFSRGFWAKLCRIKWIFFFSKARKLFWHFYNWHSLKSWKRWPRKKSNLAFLGEIFFLNSRKFTLNPNYYDVKNEYIHPWELIFRYKRPVRIQDSITRQSRLRKTWRPLSLLSHFFWLWPPLPLTFT